VVGLQVVLNTFELLMSVIVLLLAMFGSRCQPAFQRFNHASWVILAFLQLPSFLILAIFSMMVRLCSICESPFSSRLQAAVGFMVFLLFSLAASMTIWVVCVISIVLGIVSLCMTFAVRV
jgi:hypothetical protein